MTTNSIAEVAKKLSKGLLMGARGNSGVILSQIFRGIAQGLEGKDQVNAIEFAHALTKGAEVAYRAVMRPTEGTILTVIRESSTETSAYAKEDMEMEDLFSYFVDRAQVSLDHTPELLPVLKEVGVVDSGGAGLVLILSGFLAGLNGDIIERVEVVESSSKESLVEVQNDGEEGFGYCTEFIIRLDPRKAKSFTEERLKTELANIPGNSILWYKTKISLKYTCIH
jgi:dihydroxyacetone kinase-like predicted kinase